MGKWQILYLQTRYRSKLGWFFWFGPIHVTIRRNLADEHVLAAPLAVSVIAAVFPLQTLELYMGFLSNSHLPKQNWADGGTSKSKSIQTMCATV